MAELNRKPFRQGGEREKCEEERKDPQNKEYRLDGERLATMETLYLSGRNPCSAAEKPYSTNRRPPRGIQDHDEDSGTVPKMLKDIKKFVAACGICNRYKMSQLG